MHAFRRELTEENQTGQEAENISSDNAEQISLDQAMLCIRENTGKSQCPESENIVAEHLRNADDVRIHNHLQNAVSNCCHEANAKAVPIADEADEKHGEQRNAAAHRQMQELDKAGYKSKRNRHRGENKTSCSCFSSLVCLRDEACGEKKCQHDKPR